MTPLVSSLEIYPTNLKKIVLADAYGNTIDSVEYFDADPWPTSADGGGTYLDLVNTALDNNSFKLGKNDNTLTTQSFYLRPLYYLP
jgi:hypothetical protein